MDFDFSAFASQALAAVHAGNYKLLAALAVVGLVAALRKWGPEWVKGDRGGAALAFVVAMAGALVTAFSAGAGFSWQLLADAAAVALTAIGGFVGVKKLLFPADKPATPAQ